MHTLAFDEERFFLVTPCLRPATETSCHWGSFIQMMDEQEGDALL